MRRIRYSVAMSLDGYIAGPKGEADWITMDPSIDFNAIYNEFDTVLIGRRTLEAMGPNAGQSSMPGMKTILFSRTLKQEDYPKTTIISGDHRRFVTDLKAIPGKDIWLFGGGSLFASLAEDGLVDTVELGIMPVLLGEGVPLLAGPSKRIKLALNEHKVYPSGIIGLTYSIVPPKRRKAR